MSARILIVVDVQRDFCPGGALAVQEGDRIVPLINRLMREGGYDLVFASQDWHPVNHGSFASQHPGKKVFDSIDLHGLPQTLWPDHCIQNSDGAKFHPDLETDLINAGVIRKGQDPAVDSYSAFADNGQRRATELHAHIVNFAQAARLSLNEIEIDVVGLALDYCVKATAVDAAKFGHAVHIILDATRAVDSRPESVANLLRELSSQGIQTIESRERLEERCIARPADVKEMSRGISA